MVDFLPLIVVGFAASLGLTPLTRQLARRLGIMDKPSARKVHLAPTPLMGGLAIYGAFLIALLLFGSWRPHIEELNTILIGATWLALVGLLDDRKELVPWQKFAAQFAAAGLMIAVGIRVDLFHNVVLDSVLTVFWIVGIVNAINFLDNMDGLAAGISAICSLFLFILALQNGQILVAPLAAAMCGSALGFLIYNFNPATTFMGDMGSMVLGFLLAVLGIKLKFPTHDLVVTWMIPILVLGMPIFDTSLVVFTRLREGRSPFQGGKDHTSHRLVALGMSHRAAVITLYVACILLGLASIAIGAVDRSTGLLIGLVVGVIAVSSFIFLEAFRIRQQRDAKRS